MSVGYDTLRNLFGLGSAPVATPAYEIVAPVREEEPTIFQAMTQTVEDGIRRGQSAEHIVREILSELKYADLHDASTIGPGKQRISQKNQRRLRRAIDMVMNEGRG